jgi:hypothetical protein
MKAEELREEIRWIEGVIKLLDECIGLPELAEDQRDQRTRERDIATRILKRLKSNSSAFKYRLYSDFIDAYSTWYTKMVGAKPKLNPASGKAMKDIIAYLLQQEKVKTEEDALVAWKYIMGTWLRVSPFLQQQKGLIQINKNIEEILDHIRNGHAKNEPRTKQNRRPRSRARTAIAWCRSISSESKLLQLIRSRHCDRLRCR